MAAPGIAGVHLQEFWGLGVRDQQHRRAAHGAQQILQVAGAQDGHIFLQVADRRPKEGF